MHAEGLGTTASDILALVAVLIASAGYVASIVPLALTLVRVLLWLLRYRRPELGTEAPDRAFALAMASPPSPSHHCSAGGCSPNRDSSLLVCVCVVGALFNAYVWFILRDSYSVALAELPVRVRGRQARASVGERRAARNAG